MQISLFEYITVAISIVLSLGIVRLLEGMRVSITAEGRYWLHSIWMGTKLLNLVLYWWGIWSLRAIDWNLGWFVWFLLLPAMLYLQVSALVGSSPSQVVSWRDHFYGMGSWFFIVNALNVSHTFVSASILLETPLLHPMRFVQASIFACSIAGSVSVSPRVHAFVGIAIFMLVALGFGSNLFFPPGQDAI